MIEEVLVDPSVQEREIDNCGGRFLINIRYIW